MYITCTSTHVRPYIDILHFKPLSRLEWYAVIEVNFEILYLMFIGISKTTAHYVNKQNACQNKNMHVYNYICMRFVVTRVNRDYIYWIETCVLKCAALFMSKIIYSAILTYACRSICTRFDCPLLWECGQWQLVASWQLFEYWYHSQVSNTANTIVWIMYTPDVAKIDVIIYYVCTYTGTVPVLSNRQVRMLVWWVWR